MNYALALPTGGECGDPRFLTALAEHAEESGWDGVFLEDYVGYQGELTPTCDPWVALGAIAARTVRVRLATSVTPLARRRPWRVAQEAVTSAAGTPIGARRSAPSAGTARCSTRKARTT